MRKNNPALLLSCMALLLTMSCKKESVDNGGGGGGNTAAATLKLTLSSQTVEMNGYDYVDIIVKDGNGTDVTASCSLFLNDTESISNNFIPTAVGTFKVTAKKGNTVSDEKTLTVVARAASPFPQKVLVEDVTGAWCGYCTRVAWKLENFVANNPRCIVVGIHGGGTDPFNFQYYPTYNTQFGITGYPSAIVNRRRKWTENNSELDMALQQWAPVGISITSATSGSNITGTVKVKFNVTTLRPMRLVIALVENGLVHPQVNYYSPQYGTTPYLYGGVSPITDFVHKSVLRRTATDLFGDAIPQKEIVKNSEYSVPFTMSVNGNVYGGAAYAANPAKCAIVAFVVDGSSANEGALNAQYAEVGKTVGYTN